MKYTLIALNLFYLVYTKCPLLSLFKYENDNQNISDNIIKNNNNNNISSKILSNISSNLSGNLDNFTKGKATFYFRIQNNVEGCPNVQTFNDNNTYGSCGVQYNLDSKYWCAIKNAKDYCGKTLTVYYKENYINLTVMDECPSCNNNVDMGLEALIKLTGSKENACAINQQLPDISWKLLL